MKIQNKKILLTGGGGFIGSKLAELLAPNNEILVYDNFSRDSLKFKKIKSKNLKIVEGDVLDDLKLKKTCEDFKPQIVAHLAAIAGVDTVIKNPLKTMEINILGTFNLLKALQKYSNRLQRVVNWHKSNPRYFETS